MNLIGDIAGEYNSLMRLLKMMPAGPVVAVGDLNDRGKDSRKVMDFFMEHPEHQALMGNHDFFFLDGGRSPEFGIMRDWLHPQNGGHETLKNFGATDNLWESEREIPDEYLDWCETRPFILEFDDLVVTHAPLPSWHTLEQIREFKRAIDEEGEPREWRNFWRELVWNRQRPQRREKFQVYGHRGVSHTVSDARGTYAFCVDDSRRDWLVGLHWETKKLYRVPCEN